MTEVLSRMRLIDRPAARDGVQTAAEAVDILNIVEHLLARIAGLQLPLAGQLLRQAGGIDRVVPDQAIVNVAPERRAR